MRGNQNNFTYIDGGIIMKENMNYEVKVEEEVKVNDTETKIERQTEYVVFNGMIMSKKAWEELKEELRYTDT